MPLWACFHPLYRGTWYLTYNRVVVDIDIAKFPSAISRYLVSDLKAILLLSLSKSFHPLYRGTWYLTLLQSTVTSKPSSSFHPLYRGTWYLTLSKVRMVHQVGNCFHPLYRGTWYLTAIPRDKIVFEVVFPSAISRYLVSDCSVRTPKQGYNTFPSAISRYLVSDICQVYEFDNPDAAVSIRYIAVLGI